MRIFKGFAVAACLFASSFAFSMAANGQVSEQSADEIRRAIKVWIGQNVQAGSGPEQVELDGRITVIPDGDRYRVTLPGGRLVMHGDGTLHFGAINIDLRPLDNGWYDASWRFPDSYRVQPDYGSDWFITIGDQSGSGVFAPQYETLMTLDGALRAIEISEDGDDGRLTIDSITAVGRSTEVSGGIYDQNSTLRLNGLAFSSGNGEQSFEVGSMELAVTADDARLAELAEFERRANALTLEIEGSHDYDQLNAQIDSFAELIDSMPTLLAGMSMEARHGPISFQDYGDQVTIDEGTFSMIMDGLDRDRSEFAVTMSSDGVDANDPEIANLLPRESRFRLAMLNLPNTELVELGVGTLRSMGTTDPEIAMLMAAGSLQQTLTTANSTLEIGPIRLASDIASIDLEGGLRPEAKSPYSMVGEIDMVATGLDALIVEIQNSGGDQEAIQFLTLLQTLGAQAPDADGRTVRTYAFRLDAGGTLLLNGSDIMPLITGMQ